MANSVLANMSVLISANTAAFNQGLAKTQSQISTFTGNIQKMAGQVGLAFGAFQAFDIVKSAIKSIADFERELSTVKAITNATDDEFKALKKSALDLGASTRYTSKQVASLQVEYGRLGFTTPEILAATKATLSLATATGEDLAKSADVAGSTIRAFGLQASESQRVVDVMAESFNKSALGLDNFAEAMKYVAPIARASNISIEETTAMLGVLADAGIRGSMAGTSLRKIISDVGGETGTLSERLKKLADRGLTGADAMSEVGRTAYASLLVLAKNTDKTNDLTEALKNSAGAAQKTSDIVSDNLTNDVTMLSSAYDGLVQSAGDASGAMREVVQALTKIVNAFTWLSKNNGAIGKVWDVIADISTAPIRSLGWLADQLTETTDKIVDHEEKLKAITSTADAAFDSGNVEAYIKALDQNIYKEEIIAEIRRRQADDSKKAAEQTIASLTPQIGIIQAIEDQIKKFEDAKKNAFSTGEIANFNVAIEKLKDELDQLNASHPLSNFGRKQLSNATSSKPTDVDDPTASTKPSNPFSGPIAVDPIIMQKDAIIEAYLATDAAKQASAELSQRLHEEDLARGQEAAEAAMAYGNVIGESLAAAISGQQSGAQALKKITGDVIKLFLQQALAATVANAMKTGGPPPVALAIAAASTAAVGALFSKLVGGASSGGGGGGGSSMARTASSNASSIRPSDNGLRMAFDAKFQIEGDSLVAVVDKVNKRNGRLNG